MRRCEYETDDYTCSKLADSFVPGFGWVCWDHYRKATVISQPVVPLQPTVPVRKDHKGRFEPGQWKCSHCGEYNPTRRRNGVKVEFCLLCLKAK